MLGSELRRKIIDLGSGDSGHGAMEINLKRAVAVESGFGGMLQLGLRRRWRRLSLAPCGWFRVSWVGRGRRLVRALQISM
jgi:hypothetical protein